MNNARRIIKNSAAQALAFGAKSFVTMALYFIMARTSDGPELLGHFVILVTLAGIFAFISTFGLAELLDREIARIRDDFPQIRIVMNTSIGLVLVLSVLASGLLLLTSVFLGYRDDMFWAVLLTALGLALESMMHVMRSAFNGIEEMEHSSTIITTTEIAFLVIGGVVLMLNANIVWLMAAYTVARAAGLFVTFQLYHRRFGPLKPNFDSDRWRNLLKHGLPFAFNYVLSQVYVRLDVIILTFFVSTAIVGIYESATSLTIRLNIIARTINLAMLPFLSRSHTSDVQLTSQYTARTMSYLIMIGVLCAAVLALFSEQVIQLLYGDQFLLAVDSLRLMALIVPIRMIDNTLATALTASDRQVQRTTAVTVAAALNILMNLLLIPQIGMIGAVYSTVGTEFVLLALLCWYMRYELSNIFHWRIFVAPAVGVAMMLVVTALVPLDTWLVSSIVGVGVYLLVILAFDRRMCSDLSLLLGQKR